MGYLVNGMFLMIIVVVATSALIDVALYTINPESRWLAMIKSVWNCVDAMQSARHNLAPVLAIL